MNGHVYPPLFYDMIEQGSRRSAGIIARVILRHLPITSLLDVGCGQGAWLRAWQEAGVADIRGLDGAYVDQRRLEIPADRFTAVDLRAGFRLNRRFDLVQCLEVAEHLPADCAGRLVASLVAHGSMVLFSAAVPGQGGEHHVNEQPLDHWRGRFADHGFLPFDLVRPRVRNEARVEPWYRSNTLLYVARHSADRLPSEVRACAIPPDQPIPNLAPFRWRLRCAVLRHLPRPAVEALARAKRGMTLGSRVAKVFP